MSDRLVLVPEGCGILIFPLADPDDHMVDLGIAWRDVADMLDDGEDG